MQESKKKKKRTGRTTTLSQFEDDSVYSEFHYRQTVVSEPPFTLKTLLGFSTVIVRLSIGCCCCW